MDSLVDKYSKMFISKQIEINLQTISFGLSVLVLRASPIGSLIQDILNLICLLRGASKKSPKDPVKKQFSNSILKFLFFKYFSSSRMYQTRNYSGLNVVQTRVIHGLDMCYVLAHVELGVCPLKREQSAFDRYNFTSRIYHILQTKNWSL